MPLKTKVEVRFGKWFSADAWKRTPKDCKEGSATAPPDASRFQSACKRRLTRSHRDTETIYGWGPAPDPESGPINHLHFLHFYTANLHGQTYDLQIKPPMLCVSVTLCETPLPACGWRVRGGSATVVKLHLRAVGVPVSSAGARKRVNSRSRWRLTLEGQSDKIKRFLLGKEQG